MEYKSFFAGCSIWLLLVIGACAAQHEITVNCPSIKKWNSKEQGDIYQAEHALPDNSPLLPLLMDYIRMRDEAQACK